MGSEELLLESGKSGELTAVLYTLSETEVDGEPKFSPAICREIGKMVVCRTYATPILELCHLIVVAAELSLQKGRYEFLFWDSGIAKTSAFHSYCDYVFEDYTGDLININSGGARVQYQGGGDFTVQFSRMPVLSALLEFLLTALGYSDLDDDFQTLLNGQITKKTISDCANSLSRRLYAYLREHLPSAQSQRKFRKALAYCDDDVDSVDDDMILDFWQEASIETEKGVDFKTFDSALLTFVRTIQAVEAARDLSALRHAGSIGSDREAGEIDPDTLSETLDSIQETRGPLLKLASNPLNLVKFLNKQETANLECLLETGDLALRLPLSILRSDIFTKSQARLTQALRRKASPDDMANIISQTPDETYQDRQITYDSLRNHLYRATYASLHALAKARMKETITILLKLQPGIDFSPISGHLLEQEDGEQDNVVTFNQGAIAQRFVDLLHDPQTVGKELADVMTEAEEAYNGLSRKGFKQDVSPHSELAHAFCQGANLLLDIANDIEAYLERLDNLPLAGGGWQSQFSYDQNVFSSQFSKIYGDVT